MNTADTMILNSYKNLVAGLSEFLGGGFEILLYALEAEKATPIAASSPELLDVGSCPLSELLSASGQDFSELIKNSHNIYFSQNSAAEDCRYVDILICGSGSRSIGLLRLCFNLNTPFQNIIATLNEFPATQRLLNNAITDNNPELLVRFIADVQREVLDDNRILPSLKNKEIIRRCEKHGIFKIKNAVVDVANALDISKNTVYLHLKSLKNEKNSNS